MLSLTDWAKLIQNEKGRLSVMAVIAALSHRRAWPLLNLLPFMPKQGNAYEANWATSGAKKATRAMNAEFDEAAPGVSQFIFTMRAAGGDINIDRNMIGGDTSGVLRAGLLTQKVIDIGARLNRLWFYGDKDAVAGDEWHGANEFCADNSLQIEAGGAGNDGAVISSALMDEALALVPGANVILCNRTLGNQIDALNVGVQKTVILNQGTETPNMFVQSYKGVPILPVDTAPADDDGAHEAILPFNETQGDSEVASRITVARVGMDGIYGIHHGMMELDAPRSEGAFEVNHLNWFMAGLATDYPDSICQIIGVLEEEPPAGP